MFTPEIDTLPLATDSHGVIRMGGTRVTLETVIAVFNNGASAEEIAHRYSALSLADVYSVIGYYLRHQTDVDTYVSQRESTRQQARQTNEARLSMNGMRERLLARRREIT
jgi:uncharacterized protein (DUF433 family)